MLSEHPQTAGCLLMVRPLHFGFNSQTASSNVFQHKIPGLNTGKLAQDEFDTFLEQLLIENISVIKLNDLPEKETPDSVFPNNWISMHADGSLVLYPMEAANRRLERRSDLVEVLADKYGFQVNRIHDLTAHENERRFLEGTGSLVFDHVYRTVYMANSSRSHLKVLEELTSIIGYKSVVFNAVDPSGKPLYHTNVMMSIGNEFAVICSNFISDQTGRITVLKSLDQTNRKLIEITESQAASFAANILEVRNKNGDPFILLSDSALHSFSNNQRKQLEQFATLLPASIPTIEKCGGGSVRCMVAENFLPKGTQKTKVKVRQPVNRAELEACFDLRWKMLRAPWNKPKGSERDEFEDSAFHFMATDIKGKVIGTARLQHAGEAMGQVRYMAVDSSQGRQGVGKKLIEAIELFAKSQGIRIIFLQARENAIPFYKSAGYTITEKTFLLYDEIQHYRMEKKLE